MTHSAAGALPFKEGRSIRVPADKRLKFNRFSGEVMVKYAEKGKALLLVIHDDGHYAHFTQMDFGWGVT